MSTLPNPQSCRGTPSSTVRPGYRLKQTPIDKWSIREKLALASSVHRSGDQNWYSVSRSLKCFGEPNRPADWFSQKNCALQYSELLENVETPKRKRGERGESTAQDLIVLELQQKRIAELKEILVKEKQECTDLKEELDFIKSGSATADKFREVWERMKREDAEKEIAEEEHKKWLIEREGKIAQMKANRHLVLVRSPKSPKSAKSSQATSPAESDLKTKLEAIEKSSEPLTVKIEPPSTETENSQSTTPQTPTSTLQSVTPQQLQQTPHTPQQTPEKTKITPSPVISSPSTSPLLTHLLQSPSPSASGAVPYNILSPSTLKDMQQKTSPSSTHFFPTNITSPTLPRRPMTPLSNVTTEQSSTTEESKIQFKETPEQQPASTPASGLSSPSATMSSPTLSKLLETSPTTTAKALATALKETESSEIVSQDIEMAEVKESVPEIADENLKQPEQIDTSRVNKFEPIVDTVIENETVDTVKVDETKQQSIVDDKSSDLNPPSETEPISSVSSSIAEVIKSVAESYAQENADDNQYEPSEQQPQLSAEIKQESIEPKESAEELPMEVDSNKTIKIENKPDSENLNQPTTPTDSKAPLPSNSSTASRKRKRPPPIVATPSTVPTRRSNRVRTIKDKTSSEEEQVTNVVEESGSVQSVNTTAAAVTITTSTTTTTTTTTSTVVATTPTITSTTASSTILTPTSTPSVATSTPTVISAASVVPVVASVSTPVTSSTSGKKSSAPTPSVLPPPAPLSISTENSAGEESTDNTNISLPPTLIKPPTSAPTTAPTSKASSVTESAPNSPASAILTAEEIENQKEYKMWKKSIMLLWRQASTHKFSTLFAHPVTDSEAKGYSTVVYRPTDLLSIRKKLENGQIKTTAEFQRDMMLMFQNAIMYNSVDHDVHQMAVEMQKEILEGIEDFIETQQKSSSPSVNEPTKPRGRRSNVSTSSDVHVRKPIYKF